MGKEFDHSELLYRILPAIYREKDTGDLRKYLAGCGNLLDQLHRTLLQRYADIFPDSDEDFPAESQTWILPYIAELLDVRMVSPLEEGKREEIANAIKWRKGKGTLSVVEDVAEVVGGMEMVVHEGWKRVATTARVGMPLLPLESFGYIAELPKASQAPMIARHPGIPAGTVDFRCPASAVEAEEDNPAAVVSTIDGKAYPWRQGSYHGAQNCRAGRSVMPVDGREPDWIPGYFDDPSVRTVDFRDPDWRRGHFHPRRVLLFSPTVSGFFEEPVRTFNWSAGLFENSNFLELATVEQKGGQLVIRNKSLDSEKFLPIRIRFGVTLETPPSGNPDSWTFEGFVFMNDVRVNSGYLHLRRCAVKNLIVDTADTSRPVVHCRDTLFFSLRALSGLVRLRYCTVLRKTIVKEILASDCIFNGLINSSDNEASEPDSGCVRYSAFVPGQPENNVNFFHSYQMQAIFESEIYGEPGCGVLHPSTHQDIANGSVDGTEPGAYQHRFLLARRQAIVTKLMNFLPTGMTPVVIPDASLHQLPGMDEEGDDDSL